MSVSGLKSLKEARQDSGLTQVELSILIDRSVQTVQNYEQGVHCIPWDVREQIVNLVGEFIDERQP